MGHGVRNSEMVGIKKYWLYSDNNTYIPRTKHDYIEILYECGTHRKEYFKCSNALIHSLTSIAQKTFLLVEYNLNILVTKSCHTLS